MSDTRVMSRRRFLAAGATVSLSSLGGCSGAVGADSTEEAGLLRIGGVEYANLDDTAHTLEVVVSIDGEVRDWSTMELASVENAASERTNGTLDVSLPADPVAYTVIARIDRAQTAQTSSRAGIHWSTGSIPDEEPRCAEVNVRITESAELEVENWEAEQALCESDRSTPATVGQEP